MRLGSITLALINPKACSTTYIRKREKRAFLTFFEKTLTSSYQIRLSHFHAHTHTKIFDRSIDSSKPKNTRLHRSRERVVKKNVFLESVLNYASEQNRQDTRFGNTFHTRVSNSFKFVLFYKNCTSLLMHELRAKLTSLSHLLSLFHT